MEHAEVQRFSGAWELHVGLCIYLALPVPNSPLRQRFPQPGPLPSAATETSFLSFFKKKGRKRQSSCSLS